MVAHLATRRPAAAGTFYPDRPAALRSMVDDLLAKATPPPEGAPPPKALIVPHAGYIYSGPIAASAYARLFPFREGIRRVVLFGPSHFVPVRGLALPDADTFETPLGPVPVDTAAYRGASDLGQVRINLAAHAHEHSLEVQLPFLKVTLGEFTLLPFSVGDAEPDEVAEVIDRFWGGAETVVLVSSDLSHYHDYETARRLDAETARSIERLEGPVEPRRACGADAINGLLVSAARKHLSVETLDVRNSGDTVGDRSRVVGYGAFAFRE